MYDKNVKVVVIDDTDIDLIVLKDFAKDNNLPFYIVEDNQNTINKLIKVAKTRPIYFLIDANGTLHATNLSFHYDGKDIDNVIEFLKDVIEVKFENINVSDVSSNHASITWQTDKAASCWLEIKRQNELIGGCTVEWTRGTNHKMKLDYLNPNTTYIINVTAHCLQYAFMTNNISSQYAYSRSKEFSFTTIAENINAPQNVETNIPSKMPVGGLKILNISMSDITDNSAQVTWTTNKPAWCYIQSKGWQTSLDSKSINHIYTFSNLKPATEYTFQITAWYSDVSDWTLISNIQESASDVRKFKTLKAID